MIPHTHTKISHIHTKISHMDARISPKTHRDGGFGLRGIIFPSERSMLEALICPTFIPL